MGSNRIDYIDMENQETKQKILKVLEESVKKDRSKIQFRLQQCNNQE